MIKKFLPLKVLFFSLLMIGSFLLQAAWLQNEPMVVTQPNGTEIHCFATGDEFYNWLHDADNYTIIQSAEDGYYYYAELVDGKLKPSFYRVGEINPGTTSLVAGANISGLQMKLVREKTEADMQITKSKLSDSRAAGTLNNLVIYIRFSDQPEFTSDTIENYLKFNNTEPGANSLFNYFQEISYDQLQLPSTFYPVPPDNIILSYQDAFPRNYYIPYNVVTNPDGYQNGNQRTQREHQLLANAVTYINLNSPVPTSLDLDYNNDGNVDNVVFIIRGAPTAWSTLLWPHRWSLFNETVFINDKRVWDFNFQLETHMASSGVGVLCHEMYHSLGAPDLYRYNNTEITPIGPWDIMAANNNPPQYMGAFMKYKYGGWIEDIPWITESGTYTIKPLTNAQNNAFRIHSQNSSQEYFVVEYRKKEGTFESTLPKSGLLIYRINPAAGNGNASGPPDEVYVFRPDGSLTNTGNLNNAVFGTDYDRTEFNDYTNPNAFLQDGSVGGVYIYDVSSIGDSMTFSVDFPGQTQAAFSSNIKVACVGEAIQFYDQSTGIPDSWEWTFEPAGATYLEGTNSTSKNPVVSFNQEGTYTITLTASNDFGSSTIHQTDYLHIGSLYSWFTENFESGAFTNGSWSVENPDDGITWGLHNVGGNGGSLAAGIDFRNYYSIGQRDRLISMPFDLSNLSNANLSFEHAYAQNTSMVPYTDSLIVYLSDDCGLSWLRLAAYGEDGNGSFATHEPTEDAFFPLVATDWCGQGWGSLCNNINLSNWAGQRDIRIAFETYSFYGNPILIDNIEVSQYVSQEENLFAGNDIQIFPNPSSGSFTIRVTQSDEPVQFKMYNPMGQLLFEAMVNKSISVEKQNNWTPGIYLLHFNGKEGHTVKKLIID